MVVEGREHLRAISIIALRVDISIDAIIAKKAGGLRSLILRV